MPLYTRSVADHYPDRDGPSSADDCVVLSCRYQAGDLHRITAEDRWSWRVGLGVATGDFVATGYATSPEECRTHIGTTFRRMLVRADLRERPDAAGVAAPGARPTVRAAGPSLSPLFFPNP